MRVQGVFEAQVCSEVLDTSTVHPCYVGTLCNIVRMAAELV